MTFYVEYVMYTYVRHLTYIIISVLIDLSKLRQLKHTSLVVQMTSI